MPQQGDADTQTETLPPGQFLFERYTVRRVTFEEVPRIQPAEGETRPKSVGVAITIGGSIQMNPSALRALVTLDVIFEPDPKWQPYRIQVVVAGGFSGQNVAFDVFDSFCRNTVPVILFPYVREIAYTVSRDAAQGPIKIDPINIADLASKAEWGDEMTLPNPIPSELGPPS